MVHFPEALRLHSPATETLGYKQEQFSEDRRTIRKEHNLVDIVS